MGEGFLLITGRAIIPKRVRPDLRLHLLKAGYPDVPYPLLGALFFLAAGLAYLFYFFFAYRELRAYPTLQFGFLSFVVFAMLTFGFIFVISVLLYFRWNVTIYNRTKELELLLPDYLTLVSTNLKGGMSFENALWNAIKPEFGILASEIGLVSKRVMTGNQVEEALVEFSMKYDSPTLRRMVQLIVGEIESGGRIVDTIDRIIRDMKKTEMLKREMAASTITYMIFIGMLVILICPVLFALSLQLFTITSGFLGKVAGSIGTSAPGGLNVSAPTLMPSDFKLFSVLAICVIGIFSSVIISIIEKGDIRAGLKYIPMFTISGLIIYFIAVEIFTTVFKGITFG